MQTTGLDYILKVYNCRPSLATWIAYLHALSAADMDIVNPKLGLILF